MHPGRHFNEGVKRAAGYWNVLYHPSICYLPHAPSKTNSPKMADLTSDRLDPGPPFTQVAVDTFGKEIDDVTFSLCAFSFSLVFLLHSKLSMYVKLNWERKRLTIFNPKQNAGRLNMHFSK